MHHVRVHVGAFKQVVALDENMQLVSRAWCVAELVEGRGLKIQRAYVSYDCLLRSKTAALKMIRVQDCKASRPEAVEEILAQVKDKEKFNR